MGRRDIDEFRDPRYDPIAGDVVRMDLGDGEIETRSVIGKERHANGEAVVRFTVGRGTAEHRMRLSHWRELADESEVIERGRPA